MYLSRLYLNPRSRQVAAEIRHPYEMHRTISLAFPFDERYRDERILFRVEPEAERCYQVLVQSVQQPDWSKLSSHEGYFYQAANNAVSVKEFQPEYAAGAVLSFRLRANVTRKNSATKKRYALHDEEEIAGWLSRKAETGGFTVSGVEIRKETDVKPRKTDTTNFLHAVHGSVLLQGVLQVTNPVLFSQTVRQGIGSGKGLGFGLLSVAPR